MTATHPIPAGQRPTYCPDCGGHVWQLDGGAVVSVEGAGLYYPDIDPAYPDGAGLGIAHRLECPGALRDFGEPTRRR